MRPLQAWISSLLPSGMDAAYLVQGNKLSHLTVISTAHTLTPPLQPSTVESSCTVSEMRIILEIVEYGQCYFKESLCTWSTAKHEQKASAILIHTETGTQT